VTRDAGKGAVEKPIQRSLYRFGSRERRRGMTRIAALDRRVGGDTTGSSDVFAQARDCFIQRLDAAISAADYPFEVVEDLPQGIAVWRSRACDARFGG
jgi:hypothetical protein